MMAADSLHASDDLAHDASEADDQALKWSIGTFARLKPRTAEDEGKPFIPYTLFAEQNQRSRSSQTLELLRSPQPGEGELAGGNTGDEDWELEAGSTAALAGKPGSNLWHFDKVFDTEVTQESVYQAAAHPVVLGSLDGYNGTVFVYGQTGSGKTFTVQGGEGYRQRGMIPRALQGLFEEIERLCPEQAQRQQETSVDEAPTDGDSEPSDAARFKVSVSFCEIYNEGVYDLLDSSPARNGPIEIWPKVEMQMDSEGQLQLKGLRTFRTTSCEEALSLYFLGVTNRVTSATPMNHASSRSHAIFTIHVEATDEPTPADPVPSTTHGKIHFVDLAGSERVYKTRHEDEDAVFDAYNISNGSLGVAHDAKTRFEGKNINLSLHFLEQVIVSLQNKASMSDPRKAHIPYRNSVLTSYLRDALGGNCRTTFVVTLSLASDNLDETVSTCRFANRCAQLQVEVHKNRPANLEHQVLLLQQKAARLEQALAEREAEAVSAGELLKHSLRHARDLRWRLARHSRNMLSPDELALCRALVEKYLRHSPDAELALHGDAGNSQQADDHFKAETSLDSTFAANDAEAVEQLQVASTLIARLDDERADAGMLRHVLRLLRSHAEYAASVAASSTGNLTVAAEERAVLEQRERDLRDHCAELTARCKELSAACGFQPGTVVGPEAALRRSRSFDRSEEESDGEPEEELVGQLDASSIAVLDSKAVVEALGRAMASNSARMQRIRQSLDRGTLSLSCDTMAAMLTTGTLFLKHGRRGSPQGRWFWVVPETGVLRWRRHGELEARGELVLANFQEVELGSCGRVSRVRPELEDSFLVLTSQERRLVLQVDAGNSAEVRLRARNAWALAFALLLEASSPGR